MTNQIKTEAILTQEGKNEFLYLKNVPVFFAQVLEPTKKYQSEDLLINSQYSLIVTLVRS